MLVESSLSAGIDAIQIGSSLAKIGLDDGYALTEQSFQLRLVPFDGLGIREVEHGILLWKSTSRILYRKSVLNEEVEITVLGRKVRKLPQACVETLLSQI